MVLSSLAFDVKVTEDQIALKGIDTLDFSANESILVDRSKADWESNAEALDDLWVKRIKNAVLAQRLNGAEDEAIGETLRRRYEGQLKRAYQARSEDAFQAYMNAFTGMWDRTRPTFRRAPQKTSIST